MISIIVAKSDNNVIGINNSLPWHLGSDLRRFKQLTSGHSVIMGRKTFESIGHPLPNRINYVLSRHSLPNPQLHPYRFDSQVRLTQLLQEEFFVIGGEQVYKQFFPYADTLYITEVHTTVKGDAFFPSIDLSIWEETYRQNYPAGPIDDYGFSFVIYKRRLSTDTVQSLQ